MARTTRNSAETRARILELAFPEVYREGFRNASIAAILAKTKLTKGAFFYHFPTKEDLGYALVDETLRNLVLGRWVQPLAAYDNPLLGIAENFRHVIDATPESHLAFGCPLNNLVQEMAPVDPVFARKLRTVLDLWIGGVEGHLRRAQEIGQLRRGARVRPLAEFTVMCHEGAFGLVKIHRSRELFRSLAASLAHHLETYRR